MPLTGYAWPGGVSRVIPQGRVATFLNDSIMGPWPMDHMGQYGALMGRMGPCGPFRARSTFLNDSIMGPWPMDHMGQYGDLMGRMGPCGPFRARSPMWNLSGPWTAWPGMGPHGPTRDMQLWPYLGPYMIARSKDGVDLMYDRPRYSDHRLH
jgi:hypothetical protein